MVTEYVTAQEEDEQALALMWKDCFNADEEYLNLYFTQKYNPENTLVCKVDGQAAAMLTMLPCEYRQNKQKYSCMYIFAVATHPNYQGKGLCTGLLEAAHQRMAKDGVELSVLAPAEEHLFHFYRKRGYEDWFFQREKYFFSVENPVIFPEIRRIDVAEYAAYRENLLKIHDSQGWIFWDTEALAFGEAESVLYNGGLYLLKTEEVLAICYIYQEEEQALVKEFLCSELLDTKKAIELLCNSFPGKSLGFRLPPWIETDIAGEETVNGMAKWFVPAPAKHKAYLSFILD